ncbi:hypothetical protein [Mycobacterium palustre]|uniref:Uncharacterized protein n=1 Tax=Mycobacterium palustre TaxID=153971 RepID=A0A1X1ZMN5_9MYCO|nr:hypothetical protein [Mycobacterium palustre]ORW24351.1 hypothetical protein AWC19_09585 [Mycobacterium palustre]
MMFTVWLYRFNRGMAPTALDELDTRGVEKVYPGVDPARGTFFGRTWGHPIYTHASVFRRDGLAALRAEVEDVDNLLRNLRILSPSLAAMEIRNMVPRDDPDLVSLGDDGWHVQAVQPWIDVAKANPEVAYHLNVIGVSCVKNNTFPPSIVQAVWRDRLGFPQKWFGGPDARLAWPEFAAERGAKTVTQSG